MEYDLEMNAFQTGPRRRSHGAAFSGPGYFDDDDGGAGQLYKRRCGPGDTMAISGGGGPPPQAFQMLQVRNLLCISWMLNFLNSQGI